MIKVKPQKLTICPRLAENASSEMTTATQTYARPILQSDIA